MFRSPKTDFHGRLRTGAACPHSAAARPRGGLSVTGNIQPYERMLFRRTAEYEGVKGEIRQEPCGRDRKLMYRTCEERMMKKTGCGEAFCLTCHAERVSTRGCGRCSGWRHTGCCR